MGMIIWNLQDGMKRYPLHARIVSLESWPLMLTMLFLMHVQWGLQIAMKKPCRKKAKEALDKFQGFANEELRREKAAIDVMSDKSSFCTFWKR